MKLTIATCCHNRPKTTDLFLTRYKGLKEYAAMQYGIILDIVCVCSFGDVPTQEVIESHGLRITLANNSMLGEKWNIAIQLALESHPDYVCICGDDDLLLNSWLDSVQDAIGMVGPHHDSLPWVGVTTAYAVHGDEAGLLKYQKKKIMGSGCLVRSDLMRIAGTKVNTRILKATHNNFIDGEAYHRLPLAKYLSDARMVDITGLPEFRLWEPGRKRSFDLARDLAFAEMGFECQVIDTDTPTIICAKGDVSIWKWETMQGAGWMTPADRDTVIELLSDEEKEKLKLI